jgi:hypothetical protein
MSALVNQVAVNTGVTSNVNAFGVVVVVLLGLIILGLTILGITR